MAKAKKTAAKKVTRSKKKPIKRAGLKKSASRAKSASRKKSTSRPKKVPFIPTGYHSITPYLIVDRAADAIDFYKNAFGATEKMRMEKPDGRIGHAELKIGDAKIMLSDGCPEINARDPRAIGGSPVGIHLYIKDVDAVVEKALTLGARLVHPTEDMFYGDRSATIEDPFGHTWFVSTHIENVTPAQLKKRMASIKSQKESKESVEPSALS